MLETRNLSVRYGQHRALEGASVRVEAREIVVILGANGAGKSTLLKAVCGICEGTVSGEVVLDGATVSGWSANRIVEQGMALVPEGRGIFPELTVQENLKLGAYTARAREDEAGNLDRVFTLFPKLRERRRQVVRTMSGGEQQMVAVGRAMMSNPQILALDEPSLGLSPLLCRELFQSLKLIRDTGVGILLVEQNAKQSLAIADRGYLLENATIIREDSAQVLINDRAVQDAYLGAAGSASPATQPPARKTPPAAAPPRADRPPTVSPADIAAAAMRSFSSRAPVPAPGRQNQPASIGQQQPVPEVTSPPPDPPPAQPPRDRPRPGIHGIEIEELVARASRKSAEAAGRRTNGSAAPPGNGAEKRKPAPPQAVKMPELGDSSGRLQSMLREIEEAAARARNYRPPGRKD
jgi:branched-chain amino acid transport system ATP-binding protein